MSEQTADEMKPDPSSDANPDAGAVPGADAPDDLQAAGREVLDQLGSAQPEGHRVDHDDELHHDASRLTEEG